MRLTTQYREQKAGLGGAKYHYLACHVDFTHEDRALIDERGLYDLCFDLPAATPLPTQTGIAAAQLMRYAGIVLAPIGLLSFWLQEVKPGAMDGAGPFPFLILAAGVALFTIGKLKEREANRRASNPDQHFTLRNLLTKPDFIIHAYTLDQAQQFENFVRETLGALADRLRANVAIPEPTTYEL